VPGAKARHYAIMREGLAEDCRRAVQLIKAAGPKRKSDIDLYVRVWERAVRG
jgi:hypothetical protein